MELFQKEGYYVIKNGEYSLWCSRIDGSMEPRKGPPCSNMDVYAYTSAVRHKILFEFVPRREVLSPITTRIPRTVLLLFLGISVFYFSFFLTFLHFLVVGFRTVD